MEHTFQPGDYVTYCPKFGQKEHGRIKILHTNGASAWVVYHCAGEWERYEAYTGALTNFSDLKKGWI
jgi:hypothetical protein